MSPAISALTSAWVGRLDGLQSRVDGGDQFLDGRESDGPRDVDAARDAAVDAAACCVSACRVDDSMIAGSDRRDDGRVRRQDAHVAGALLNMNRLDAALLSQLLDALHQDVQADRNDVFQD
jgi:hypothetical protein